MEGPACKNLSSGWLGRASSQVMDGLGLSSLRLIVHYLKSCSKFRKTEMKAGAPAELNSTEVCLQLCKTIRSLKFCPHPQNRNWRQVLSRAKPSTPRNLVQNSGKSNHLLSPALFSIVSIAGRTFIVDPENETGKPGGK